MIKVNSNDFDTIDSYVIHQGTLICEGVKINKYQNYSVNSVVNVIN